MRGICCAYAWGGGNTGVICDAIETTEDIGTPSRKVLFEYGNLITLALESARIARRSTNSPFDTRRVLTAIPYQFIYRPMNLFLHLTIFKVTLRLQLGTPYCRLLETLDQSSASL